MVATQARDCLWPGGRVPFELHGNPSHEAIVRAMREIERWCGDWSVYLRDDSRGYGIQLDVFRRRIRLNTDTTPWSHLYDIVEARRYVD